MIGKKWNIRFLHGLPGASYKNPEEDALKKVSDDRNAGLCRVGGG
jgi:hypothetical protein